jgi:hypothetical protein
MAQNSRQYRLVLIHPDGSTQPDQMYTSREALDKAMFTVKKKPGVRYHCEEYTVGTPTKEQPDPPIEKVAEYDL